MPAELVHLSIATRVEERLSLAPELRPSFVLGDVAPDVNNLLGWQRQVTHFWFWPEGNDVSGALTLLGHYPQLGARHLSPLEQAFVAGYLCHLITDEQELVTLYRPYVARPSGNGRERRIASLIVVDAEVERSNSGHRRTAVGELRDASHLHLREDLLPFVSMTAVRAWAERTLAVADSPPGPARAEPHVRPEERPADVEQRVLALERDVSRTLPLAAIRSFEERSVSESVAFIEAYLAGGPLPTPQGTTSPQELDHVSG